MHTVPTSRRLSCAGGIVACRSRLIPDECSFSSSLAFIAERARGGMPPPPPPVPTQTRSLCQEHLFVKHEGLRGMREVGRRKAASGEGEEEIKKRRAGKKDVRWSNLQVDLDPSRLGVETEARINNVARRETGCRLCLT